MPESTVLPHEPGNRVLTGTSAFRWMPWTSRPALQKRYWRAEIVRKTKKYEPRVEVVRIEWDTSKVGQGY